MPERRKYPWDRQKGETRKAFEAFLAYRDLGAVRSTEKVGKALGKSHHLIMRWCSRWGWVERVAEYDEAVRADAEHRAWERRVEEQLEEGDNREKERKSRVGGARLIRSVGAAIAAEIGDAIAQGEHKQQLKCPGCGKVVGVDRITKLASYARQVAPMFEKGAAIERLEEEKPTAIVETRLTPSQERQIAEIIRDVVPQEQWEIAVQRMDEAFGNNGKVEHGDSG